MSAQGDRIKAVLTAYSDGGTGLADDVTALIAKIRVGAPDLLTEDELAAHEQRAASFKALAASTDPATITADQPPVENPPADQV